MYKCSQYVIVGTYTYKTGLYSQTNKIEIWIFYCVSHCTSVLGVPFIKFIASEPCKSTAIVGETLIILFSISKEVGEAH